MRLAELALTASFMGLSACATMSSVAVCKDGNPTGRICKGDYPDRTVSYFVGTTDEPKVPLCSIHIEFKKSGFVVDLDDFFCDRITDTHCSYTKTADGIHDYVCSARNSWTEDLFSEYDKLFSDPLFQKMKEMVIGGNEK